MFFRAIVAVWRLLPIQSVIDHTIRDILGSSSNYCRKAAYEELSVPCMALWGTKGKAQAITKWESRTTIGVLLNSSYKHQCATWMMGIRRWMHTLLHINTSKQFYEAVSAMVNARIVYLLLRKGAQSSTSDGSII